MNITIWTKYCLECLQTTDWAILQGWAGRNNVHIKIRRTAYRPDWHRKAARLCGREDYEAFASDADGHVVPLSMLVSQIKKGDDDVLQGLYRTKRTNRKTRMARKKKTPSQKTQGEVEDA